MATSKKPKPIDAHDRDALKAADDHGFRVSTATSKKAQPIERTVHALPMPVTLDAGFSSLTFAHKRKHYMLTMTVNVTSDTQTAARWTRQVAWTHRPSDLRGFAEPQHVTGFLAPSEFVLRGAGSRVELILDVERDRTGAVVPIITTIANHRRGDVGSLRFPAELPPLEKITDKAARLAFVAGLATAPGEYTITEFARGQQRDVKNLSNHPWPYDSPEAIDVFLAEFDASTLNTHRANAEYARVAKETRRALNTVKSQRTIAIKRGLLKLPPKGQTK